MGLLSWDIPDSLPVDFFLMILDHGQTYASLHKVWALILIHQSGVSLLGSSQQEANSCQERGALGVLEHLSQL